MKVSFVPTNAAYAESFLSWREDKETIRYNPLAASNLEAIRKRLSGACSDFTQFESADAFMWFVELDGELAGQASLQAINRMMLTAEIGYTVAPAARGKGVASAAVRMITENAFAATPLRKLIAFVHDDNVASKRVLEKAGYKQEGLLREHYLVNGKPADEAIFGILRAEAGRA